MSINELIGILTKKAQDAERVNKSFVSISVYDLKKLLEQASIKHADPPELTTHIETPERRVNITNVDSGKF